MKNNLLFNLKGHITEKEASRSMKAAVLIFTLALSGIVIIGTGAATAATISFLEDPLDTAPIVVNTDIAGAVITAGLESASLSLGDVMGPSTLIIAKALVQPGTMHMEGGGMGVSDILDLFTFLSPTGLPIGFQVLFRSDGETGLTNPGNLTPPDIVETGILQAMFSGSVILPGIGPTDLTVNAQSDVDSVPEPSMTAVVGVGLLWLGIVRRRQHVRLKSS